MNHFYTRNCSWNKMSTWRIRYRFCFLSKSLKSKIHFITAIRVKFRRLNFLHSQNNITSKGHDCLVEAKLMRVNDWQWTFHSCAKTRKENNINAKFSRWSLFKFMINGLRWNCIVLNYMLMLYRSLSVSYGFHWLSLGSYRKLLDTYWSNHRENEA